LTSASGPAIIGPWHVNHLAVKPDIAGEYAPHGALLTAGWRYWRWRPLLAIPLTSRSGKGVRPCPFFHGPMAPVSRRLEGKGPLISGKTSTAKRERGVPLYFP